MKRYTFLILCAIILPMLLGNAQNRTAQNFSGDWKGDATWGAWKFKMSLDVDQDGTKLRGIVLTENLNNDNFIKYEFIGDLGDEFAMARGVKLIEKKGLTHCMPAFTLQFSEKDPQ